MERIHEYVIITFTLPWDFYQLCFIHFSRLYFKLKYRCQYLVIISLVIRDSFFLFFLNIINKYINRYYFSCN